MAASNPPDAPVRDPLEGARQIAIEIAHEAGRILLEGWGTRPVVGYKSEDIDLVTEYDKRSEALIVERLAKAFPHDRIVAEEGTNVAGDPGGAVRVWYVDPLDGTTNFAHGLPLFSVSIGLCVNRRPVLGVVEAPALGWTFAGTITGGGSTFNGKPIVPSPHRSARERAAGHRVSVRAKPGPEQSRGVDGPDRRGAGDATARLRGAGPLFRRLRLARRILGARAASVGSRRRRGHRARRGRASERSRRPPLRRRDRSRAREQRPPPRPDHAHPAGRGPAGERAVAVSRVAMTSARAARAAAAAVVGAVVALPFFVATTFIGDDHLFLAFARYAPHPLLPFVTDQHGGEYYRPLPMAVWWLLGRAGGGSASFGALALALHATASLLVAALLRGLGRPRPVAVGAAALMFLAPQNMEAAYWFAASTDLFATVFVLWALVALGRERVAVSAFAALAAYLSKESAFVLPLLAVVVLRSPWRRRAVVVAPHLALLAGVLVLRTLVLHGRGGSGDARAGLLGEALQIASGLAHVFTGEALVPEVLAFGAGTAVIGLSALAAFRRREAGLAPFAFAAIAVLPLAAAGWATGARYFYLPSVGLAWASAEALAGASDATRGTIAGVLLLLVAGQAVRRRQDVVSYDRRVAAARRGVEAGIGAGHHVFHVDGGIKDLDLAVKESPHSRLRRGRAADPQ